MSVDAPAGARSSTRTNSAHAIMVAPLHRFGHAPLAPGRQRNAATAIVMQPPVH